MASSNNHVQNTGNFIWIDEYIIILCDVCLQYIMKNGHKQSFKWYELEQDFIRITNHKCSDKSLKNKYDSMKRDWRLWKQLKRVETGLRWDHISRKPSWLNEWWDIKLKVSFFFLIDTIKQI